MIAQTLIGGRVFVMTETFHWIGVLESVDASAMRLSKPALVTQTGTMATLFTRGPEIAEPLPVEWIEIAMGYVLVVAPYQPALPTAPVGL